MKIVFALARALGEASSMSQSHDKANCFSRPVRQAVTPLNAEAFSSDAKRLLHNSASAALHRGPSTPVYNSESNRFGMTEPYGTQA